MAAWAPALLRAMAWSTEAGEAGESMSWGLSGCKVTCEVGLFDRGDDILAGGEWMIVERRDRRREANISETGGLWRAGSRVVFARDHVGKMKSRYLGLVVALWLLHATH